MSELLPCPFCGSNIVGALTHSTDTHARLGVVGCGVCGTNGPRLWDTPHELIDAWNRRATPSPMPETVDDIARRIAQKVWDDTDIESMAPTSLALMIGPLVAPLVQRAEAAEREREELRKAVKTLSEKLPNFKDGPPAGIGDMAYAIHEGVVMECRVAWGVLPRTGGCDGYIVEPDDPPFFTKRVYDAYSTKEAALAGVPAAKEGT